MERFLEGQRGHITSRHHPRKRMIQYSRARDISCTAVITGYPPEPVIGLAEGETRWRVEVQPSFERLRMTPFPQ
jgi:hypothetical protein